MNNLPEEIVADASVLLSFFRRDAGELQPVCDSLLAAIVDASTSLLLLDLAAYEFTNVVVRRFGVPGDEASALVSNLFDLVDYMIRVGPALAARAAAIAADTGLSAYDAAYIAAGHTTGALVVTLDDRVAAAGAVHLRDLAA